MRLFPSLPPWAARGLSMAVIALLTAPAALAGDGGGSGGGREIAAASNLAAFLETIRNLFTGPIGTSIGIIAFAVAGIYIMYARQTGQAIGAIAKVFVGLLILFGGTALVASIGEGSGAAF